MNQLEHQQNSSQEELEAIFNDDFGDVNNLILKYRTQPTEIDDDQVVQDEQGRAESS